MPNYGDPKYWDKRYRDQEDTTFDWLEDYESLKSILKDLVTPESKILILGCGNAEFSEHMYDDGYELIENIDISSVVIEQMRKRSRARTNMTWEVMDVRDMKYPDNYFDLAIDKSTIDALLCGEDAFVNVAKMTKEVQRILKQDANYVVISYGKPENRISHFHRDHLSFELQQYTISPAEEENKEDKCHYIYICKKKEGADAVSEENWEAVLKELQLEYEEEKRHARDGDEEDSGEEEENEARIHE